METKVVRKICILMILAAMVSAVNATLISHYEFESNWDNSVAGSFPGILTGTGNTSVVSNDSERGLVADLTGANSWVYVGYDTALNSIATNQQFTIATWVKSTAGLTWQQIFGRRTEWGIRMVEGKVQLFTAGGTLGGTTAINDGQWHHIAASYDGTTGLAAVYVDGVQEATSTITTTLVSSLRAAIGGRSSAYSTADFIYTGYVDDLRVYDNALSSTEIAQIVPEPATICILGLGALGLIRRKK